MSNWTVTVRAKSGVRIRGAKGQVVGSTRTISVNGPSTQEGAEAAALQSLGMGPDDAESVKAVKAGG